MIAAVAGCLLGVWIGVMCAGMWSYSESRVAERKYAEAQEHQREMLRRLGECRQG